LKHLLTETYIQQSGATAWVQPVDQSYDKSFKRALRGWLGMLAYTGDPSTWEVKAKGLQVQGQSKLYNKSCQRKEWGREIYIYIYLCIYIYTWI
jgi:hypothetical protein